MSMVNGKKSSKGQYKDPSKHPSRRASVRVCVCVCLARTVNVIDADVVWWTGAMRHSTSHSFSDRACGMTVGRRACVGVCLFKRRITSLALI